MDLTINEEELIGLVQDLVRLPSVNPPGREQLVTRYLTKFLADEGMNYWTVEAAPDRHNVLVLLEGEMRGEGLIFTGHQDVVPVSQDEMQRWSGDPFSGTLVGDYMYGRGSSDMKGGLGAALMAMVTLHRAGIRPKRDILLAATVDEEHYMKGSQACLDDNYIKSARCVVVCEPTEMKLCIASRGRTWGEVIVHGKTAHGSQHGLGVNAIEKMSDLIQAIKAYDFSDQQDNLGGRTFWQPYAISAGVEPAIVPDRCSMFVDARLCLGHYPEEIWAALRRIFAELKAADPQFAAEIKVVEKRAPWETAVNHPLVKLVETASDKHGLKPAHDVFAGTTDGTKFNRIGITPVIFGPGDLSCVHKENERLDVKELITAAKIYMDMMMTYE
ncbi:MAG: M20 family metallopeptidase [Eubacteriales bacterium]|nr:M20 family metallopeptidase [Eubacteriales bacterium]